MIAGFICFIILCACLAVYQEAAREAKDRASDRRSSWEARRSLRVFRGREND